MDTESLLAHVNQSASDSAAYRRSKAQQAQPGGLTAGERLGAWTLGAANIPAAAAGIAGGVNWGLGKLTQGISYGLGGVGYGANKLLEGASSGFGLAPNQFSDFFGRQASASMKSGAEVGDFLAKQGKDDEKSTEFWRKKFEGEDYLGEGGVYRAAFGRKEEQARQEGRTAGEIAATMLIPVPGMAAAGRIGGAVGAKGLGMFGPTLGRFGMGIGRAGAEGAYAGGLQGGLTGFASGLEQGTPFSSALKGAGEGAVTGAAFGSALGLAGKALGAAAGTKAAGSAEEMARGAYNRVAYSAGERLPLVSPEPIYLGKAPAAARAAAEEAAYTRAKAGPVFGRANKGAVGGGSQAAQAAEDLSTVAEGIQAGVDQLNVTGAEARQMKQVAQAFQLPKVKSVEALRNNNRTVLEGIETVGQVVGKRTPTDTVSAMDDLVRAKQKLMPIITEANAKVTEPVSAGQAARVAGSVMADASVATEALVGSVRPKEVQKFAQQLAGKTQQELQMIKNSLAKSVRGKAASDYAGATSDSVKLRIVSEIMDENVVRALGQSNKPVSQQLAKLNAYEKFLAGVASVDLRKADASLGNIIWAALADGDLGGIKRGLVKKAAGSAVAAIDRLRGKDNLIAALYRDVYEKGAPSGRFSFAGDTSPDVMVHPSGAKATRLEAFEPEGMKKNAGGAVGRDVPEVPFGPDASPETVLEFARENRGAILDAYSKKHGNIVNSDDFREFLGESIGVPASRTHAAASELADEYLQGIVQRAADKAAAGGQKDFVFLAGGGGSGKSGTSDRARAMFGADVPALDGTLKSLASSEKRLSGMAMLGLEPKVMYTHRPAELAWEGVLDRTARQNAKKGMGNGRTVPAGVFLDAHVGARDTALKLKNKGYDVEFVDNSGLKGQERIISPEEAAKAFSADPIDAGTEKKMRAAVDRYLQDGKITPEQARDLLDFSSRKSPENKSFADEVQSAILADGGVTISLSGVVPSEGFAYAPLKNSEKIVPLSGFSQNDIDDFIQLHRKTLTQPGHFVGGWVNDGNLYLDVSRVGAPTAKTLEEAASASQLAAYDIGGKREIKLGRMEGDQYVRNEEPAAIFQRLNAK